MTAAQKVTEYVDFIPPADVIENHGDIRIMIDVPGACEDSLNINFEEGALKVSADTCINRCEKSVRYQRTFQVSDQIDANKIKAKLSEGVLELTLPKHEHAKVHKIKIES